MKLRFPACCVRVCVCASVCVCAGARVHVCVYIHVKASSLMKARLPAHTHANIPTPGICAHTCHTPALSFVHKHPLTAVYTPTPVIEDAHTVRIPASAAQKEPRTRRCAMRMSSAAKSIPATCGLVLMCVWEARVGVSVSKHVLIDPAVRLIDTRSYSCSLH